MSQIGAFARSAILVLLLSSCALQRSNRARAPVAGTNLTQVLSDPAVERITKSLQGQGFDLKALNVSQVAPLADSPGAAFTVSGGSLHIHTYRDPAAAASAAHRIVNGPVGRYKWAAPPMFYQCGSAIVMYAGPTPSVASALRQLCASPFYVHPSLREHSAELISEGPAELRSQVSRLNVWRRQIAEQARRRARKMAGARNCAAIDLPESAFLPVEITGDATPELAVSLNQLTCPRGVFGGSAGGVVQFWSTTGRRPQLILEQQIIGFAARDGSLVTLQNNGLCGPAGMARCLVTYNWDRKARKMVIGNRVATTERDGLATITFDHELRRRAPTAP